MELFVLRLSVSTQHQPLLVTDRDGVKGIQHRARHTVGAQQVSHLLWGLGSEVSKGKSFDSPQ